MDDHLSAIRSRRKRTILEAAFRVFLKTGIHNAAMETIASEAKTTRQTMYRYFLSKDALAFSVEMMVLERIFARLNDLFATADGLHSEQFLGLLDSLIPQFITDYSAELLYTGIFDSYYRHYPDPDYITQMQEALREYRNPFTRIVRERGDREYIRAIGTTAEIIGETLSNSLLAMCQRVLMRRDILQKEYGLDPIVMVPVQMKLMLSGCLTPGVPIKTSD